MNYSITQNGNTWILYDTQVTNEAIIHCFSPQWLTERQAIWGHAGGRGTVYMFRFEGTQYVLRHYNRGGHIAELMGDRYLWTGIKNTRAWREWQLLAHMTGLGLPVPRPFAARIQRNGLFYTCDLITRFIPECVTLAESLLAGPMADDLWRLLGRTLRQFHDHRICHADLNAHNILIREDRSVFILDFDRGRVRRGNGWKRRNLARLHRSLLKVTSRSDYAGATTEYWRVLMGAYDATNRVKGSQ